MNIPDDEMLISTMQTAIADELRFCVDQYMRGFPKEFSSMIEYQLGLAPADQVSSRGKRLRPLIVLAVCHALGGNWLLAKPAAAAVELMHNFSLIHDDIQDGSLLRRGKDTLWVKWGMPQAINAGDAMFALSNNLSLSLSAVFDRETTLKANEIMQIACLNLTRGQYLDLAFEKAENISIPDYWQMVEGKTGSLLGACFELGALLAGKQGDSLTAFLRIGSEIGTAFQVQDDWLGIWGEEQITGKSNSNDLLERKKTFPVLRALESSKEFHEFWGTHLQFTQDDIQVMMGILEKTNLKAILLEEIDELYKTAEVELKNLFPEKEAYRFMQAVLGSLLSRAN